MKTNQQKGLLLRKLLMLIVATMTFHISKAQDTPYRKTVAFKVRINTNADAPITKGYLYSIYDTSVYISEKPVFFKGYTSDQQGLRKISYNDISKITLRRKGSTGRGMWIGALSGAGIGVIGGLASGDDRSNSNSWCIPCFSAGEKAAVFGILSGLAGFGVGTVVGSVAKKTFIIKNDKEKFNEFKRKLVH
jgi:hypothetical protein